MRAGTGEVRGSRHPAHRPPTAGTVCGCGGPQSHMPSPKRSALCVGSPSRRRPGSQVRSPAPAGRAGQDPETVKPCLISTKRASAGVAAARFCRHDGTLCRQEPAQPSILPAGNLPGSRYLEFAGCSGAGRGNPPGAILAGRPGPTQLAGTGEDRRAAILRAQRPNGALRMWWSPMHRIRRQARIHHRNRR